MNAHIWLDLMPYIISALISAGISLEILNRRMTSGARQYACLAALESLWAAGVVFQSIAAGLPAKLFWNNVQFIGAIGAPLAFYWFALHFSGYLTPGLRRMGRFAFWLSAVLLLLIWTDTWHHGFRINPHVEVSASLTFLAYEDGPLFLLLSLLEYSLLSTGSFLLAKKIFSSARIYRLQTLTVLVGILIPWVTSLLSWLRILPVFLHEITPLTFAVSNLIVIWGLSRYGLFDLAPVAYETLVDHMEDGLLVLDSMLRIVDLNRVAREILHLTYDEAIGLPFRYAHPAFSSLVNRAQNGRPAEISLTANGKTRYFEARLMELNESRRAAGGRLVLLRDITERRENEERLQRMAITDPLTEVYNRRQFFALAEVEYKRAARNRLPFSIILLDIDHFKAVNDQYGHLTGDQVLQQAVIRFQAHLRPYDIFARYGGDEFVLLLPETDTLESGNIAERLRQAISSPALITQAGSIDITISIGVSACESPVYPHLDQMIDCADQALYSAKLRGRNQVFLWGQPMPNDLPVT